jgi:hypothetical protein
MKTILILTGPQGSGNHLWSKIFALHPQVSGWRALLTSYWIGHDQEPFAEYWQDPEQLRHYKWAQSDWYVTSMSVPYMMNGVPTVPDFKAFVNKLQIAGVRIKFAVLGRDRNIVEMQQARVRGAPTLATALAEFDQLSAPAFLSYELLHLYGQKYLENIQQQLEFPIATNDPRLKDILAEDANTKYFHPIAHHTTDDLARYTSRKHT